MAQTVKYLPTVWVGLGSIPGLGRSPGEGNGNPLQYSCLENPTGGVHWQAIVHGVTKSRTRLRDFTSLHFTTEFHRRNLFLTFLEARKSKTKVPADLLLGEELLLG